MLENRKAGAHHSAALSSGPYSKNWNIWENRGTTRSRHKTANCADNITLLATCGRGVRIATRGSQNMNEFYLSDSRHLAAHGRRRARGLCPGNAAVRGPPDVCCSSWWLQGRE